MDEQFLRTVVDTLDAQGVRFEPGLTDAEIRRIEETNAVRFPHDVRAWLQYALPTGMPEPESGEIVVGAPFPEWRALPEDYLAQRFAAVLDGICFDIRHGFWNPRWGTEPADCDDACDVARQELATAPKLIPVFAHRFIPAEPLLAGSPIFSIHQTDIMIYGNDIADYLAEEFGVPRPAPAAKMARAVPVWTESLRWRYPDYWHGRDFSHR